MSLFGAMKITVDLSTINLMTETTVITTDVIISIATTTLIMMVVKIKFLIIMLRLDAILRLVGDPFYTASSQKHLLVSLCRPLLHLARPPFLGSKITKSTITMS